MVLFCPLIMNRMDQLFFIFLYRFSFNNKILETKGYTNLISSVIPNFLNIYVARFSNITTNITFRFKSIFTGKKYLHTCYDQGSIAGEQAPSQAPLVTIVLRNKLKYSWLEVFKNLQSTGIINYIDVPYFTICCWVATIDVVIHAPTQCCFCN